MRAFMVWMLLLVYGLAIADRFSVLCYCGATFFVHRFLLSTCMCNLTLNALFPLLSFRRFLSLSPSVDAIDFIY